MAELGQTTNPKELVPGNPEAVNNAADALVKDGDRMESVGQGLGRIETPGWAGEASNAFWDKFSGERPNWFKGSDAMSAAAKALTGHAGVLSWAQSQAQEAIDLWERGEAATREAVAQHNAAVEQANTQNQAAAAAGDPSRVTVSPFSDPGEELRQQAQELLGRAREQLNEAGIRTAQAISGHAGNGADAPSWLAKAADVADAAINEHGLGSTSREWFKAGDDGPVNDSDKIWGRGTEGYEKPGGSNWEVMLAEASGEANLWEAGVAGETQLAGATLEGSAALKTLGVEGSAGLSITGDGLKAQAGANAYLAKAVAEGSAQYGIVGASAKGEAYVGAEANAEATIGKDGVHVGAEAFAGAKAEGSVNADVAGIGAGVTGEAWAGIGAEADATIGMEDGKFTIGGELGVGLGVGGKIGGEITIDPGEVVDTASDAANAVADFGGDALDAAGDVVSDLNPF